MADFHENCIEWITNDDRITVTFTQPRMITRIKNLAKTHPDDVDYIINKDGSLFGHVPLRFLKLNPPPKLTDEQIAAKLANFQNRCDSRPAARASTENEED